MVILLVAQLTIASIVEENRRAYEAYRSCIIRSIEGMAVSRETVETILAASRSKCRQQRTMAEIKFLKNDLNLQNEHMKTSQNLERIGMTDEEMMSHFDSELSEDVAARVIKIRSEGAHAQN